MHKTTFSCSSSSVYYGQKTVHKQKSISLRERLLWETERDLSLKPSWKKQEDDPRRTWWWWWCMFIVVIVVHKILTHIPLFHLHVIEWERRSKSWDWMNERQNDEGKKKCRTKLTETSFPCLPLIVFPSVGLRATSNSTNKFSVPRKKTLTPDDVRTFVFPGFISSFISSSSSFIAWTTTNFPMKPTQIISIQLHSALVHSISWLLLKQQQFLPSVKMITCVQKI